MGSVVELVVVWSAVSHLESSKLGSDSGDAGLYFQVALVRSVILILGFWNLIIPVQEPYDDFLRETFLPFQWKFLILSEATTSIGVSVSMSPRNDKVSPEIEALRTRYGPWMSTRCSLETTGAHHFVAVEYPDTKIKTSLSPPLTWMAVVPFLGCS